MRMLLIASALYASTASLDCGHKTPPPVPPPVPDVADAGPGPAPDSKAALACQNIKQIGCIEGQRTYCAAVLDRVQTSRQGDFHVDCLIAARTKEAVRGCCVPGGATACNRVECP